MFVDLFCCFACWFENVARWLWHAPTYSLFISAVGTDGHYMVGVLFPGVTDSQESTTKAWSRSRGRRAQARTLQVLLPCFPEKKRRPDKK